ncbi:unnamed protein product [Gongylonema pulchrum]|uniref:Transporter n=1 Tax=Gongylonema pulchrum TaxID=637853 RepID=A0A183E6M2_9BILA|nr:unnamed protein product [Gongylonema pulchrum]
MPAFSAFRRSDDASSYSTPARRHSDISAIDFDIPSPLPAGQSRAPGPDLSGSGSVRATPRNAGRQMWPYELESSESDLGFFHPQPSRLDETRMTSDEVFDYADIHGFGANEEFVAPHELWDPVRQRIRGLVIFKPYLLLWPMATLSAPAANSFKEQIPAPVDFRLFIYFL